MSMGNKIQNNDKQSIKPQWTDLAILLALLVAAFGIYRYIFDQPAYCVSSIFSVVALQFAIIAIAFSFIFLFASLNKKVLRNVAEIYPDPQGRGEWNARQAYRLGAISNLGYALVMLSCGWAWPYGSDILWEYFAIFFGIGITIVLLCKIILWKNYINFRLTFIKSYSLASFIFIILTSIFILIWTFWIFYFDFTVFIIIYTISVFAAGLVVGQRDLIAYKKNKAAENSQGLQ